MPQVDTVICDKRPFHVHLFVLTLCFYLNYRPHIWLDQLSVSMVMSSSCGAMVQLPTGGPDEAGRTGHLPSVSGHVSSP